MRFIIQNEKLFPDFLTGEPISRIQTIPMPPINSAFDYDRDLQHLLTGKQLLLDDIPSTFNKIYSHYENGYITFRKGIEYIGNGKMPRCSRCGNTETHWFGSMPCARCGETCLYCRHCIMMGRITACTPLIGWQGPVPDTSFLLEGAIPDNNVPYPLLEWQGQLSKGQEAASYEVVQAIQQNKELLVWAVCGAGKTEVLFAGIDAALKENKRVCIATPRTDVVLELTPRLKAAFPKVPVASLYGGSDDRQRYAPLSISTTHQLLRFYQAFDTLILDEVDAFPYTVEESLQYAAIQARKPQSAMIFLTATPNEKWQRECHSGKRAFTTIPARFHRHPLPVPEFRWCGDWQKRLKKGKLPTTILHWIKERQKIGKQTLVFFPHISLMEKALPIVRTIVPASEAVHAEDQARKEKVQKMREKEFSLLLTTTILERGVTFSNIDVAIVGAEESIFNESALVQIAGRAGRSKDFPGGTVTFFHYGKSDEMLKARRQITRMNKEGKERGLLDP